MSDLRHAFAEAPRLIMSVDSDFTTIVFASLRFSITSTILAAALGIPFGISLANAQFRLKRFVEDVLNMLLAVPTVVVGLFVYTLIFSQGPWENFICFSRLRVLFLDKFC